MNITTGISNNSTITFYNRSISNKSFTTRTPSLHIWKKSNSIEILKKLIAHRQGSSKNNRTLLITNTTRRVTSTSPSPLPVRLKSTSKTKNIALKSSSTKFIDKKILYMPDNYFLNSPPLPTIDISAASNTTVIAIIFICCLCSLLLLSFIFTFFLREHFHHTYFKLPCIHSLSTTKQSRESTPLSYSSIHSKHRKD
ncbi:unnamed protein product [Adineta steineri]|uniref:Uncharacterized protein n=1 Tax=Adineta steineri TaxID=433720 RepID=A0A813MP57_9BILA|nr:unnamed protein product [Adineta steineri]